MPPKKPNGAPTYLPSASACWRCWPASRFLSPKNSAPTPWLPVLLPTPVPRWPSNSGASPTPVRSWRTGRKCAPIRRKPSPNKTPKKPALPWNGCSAPTTTSSKKARADIAALRYDAARAGLHNAAALGRKTGQIANVLLEIAYFFNESGQKAAAQKELTKAAILLGKNANPGSGDRSALRSALQALSPARFSELEARYYPVLIPVKGSAGLPDFKLAKTETTVWQYNLFLQAQGKNMLDETVIKRPGWGWAGNNPVVFVSWYDAVQYANWLLKWTVTLRENATGYRLPRAAEWEYAALDGPNKAKFEYAGSDNPDAVAWYGANAQKRTQAVGGKKPNSLGLYDLTGNVWEWCWDWDTESFGRYRVVRGGGWGNLDTSIRIADSGKRTPNSQADMYGFRVAQGR
ncbi:MAG: SUMF1/EgtB/PvdO family nonheme iron enzyme [Lewinellaceae bacterium]|nr:SUMF1/EgtB/PvdO family nonheme iron enzyme [Lewinellaceae bacterium]